MSIVRAHTTQLPSDPIPIRFCKTYNDVINSKNETDLDFPCVYQIPA